MNGDDMDPTLPPDRIGYVINTYPRPSQTFIRREIRALEAAGLTVARFAMRRDDQPVLSAEDRAEADQTEYVLDRGALTLGMALIRAVIRHPRSLLRALSASAR